MMTEFGEGFLKSINEARAYAREIPLVVHKPVNLKEVRKTARLT